MTNNPMLILVKSQYGLTTEEAQSLIMSNQDYFRYWLFVNAETLVYMVKTEINKMGKQ